MRWRGNGDGNSITGSEAIRMLHRSASGLGIVAHGELPERHLASLAMQAGASAYVAKSLDFAELRRRLRSLVEFWSVATLPRRAADAG